MYVKAGVCKESVTIRKELKNLMMAGDGIGATVVMGSKSYKDDCTTFGSATSGKQIINFILIIYIIAHIILIYYPHRLWIYRESEILQWCGTTVTRLL